VNYSILKLSAELFYIRWLSSAKENTHPEKEFIPELSSLLDKSPHPVYFISDLRKGRIMTVNVLNQLATLSHHKNWAGSTAFSSDPIASIFVGTFSKLAKQKSEHREIYTTPEESLAYLESLKAGLTQDIDWNSVLNQTA
jgi:hypothetical protein